MSIATLENDQLLDDGSILDFIEPVDISQINETTENWRIYRKPAEDDPAFQALCVSIHNTGINTPLELSSDFYIISGHRRYLASMKVGLTIIPCIIDDDINMAALDPEERIKLLIERNAGVRVKSDAEAYLEAAAKVDPEAAISEAEARKAEHFNRAKCSVEMVKSTGKSRRTDPSKARGELLNAIIEILDELRSKNHLPNSSRHIHYKLLAKKVRTSNYKNGFIYGTRPGSADALSKIMTDARSEGLIDPNDINDETRPTERIEHDGDMASYVEKKLDGLFGNFFSNVHADQQHHIELLIEKNTLYPLLLNHVARKFRIPISSMRGYGSFPVSRDIASRFKESGKDSLVIIYASDLDPEGCDMPAAVKKYLYVDFGVEANVVRAAVTMDQVKRFKLPHDADAKISSSRYASFVKQYGKKCWELDSFPSEILISEISKAVTKFLDIDAFNAAFQREKEADVKLARMTAAVSAFVRDQFRQEVAQ